MVGSAPCPEHAHGQAANALPRMGAHSEHAVERGERGGPVAWQPPQVQDEDLVPPIAGGLPRHLVTSHRDSAQTPGRIRPPGHGPAVDGGAVDAQADQDAQEFVAVADLAVLVGVAWALKSRDYAEEVPGTGATSLLFCQIERRLAGVSSPSSRSVSGTAG